MSFELVGTNQLKTQNSKLITPQKWRVRGMAATKRLSPVATQETLDKLAADVSMPIPDMGQARLLAGIFNVLGLGFIILGAVALYFGLQPASMQTTPSNTTNLLTEMGEMFGGSSRAALVLASIVGIVG